jgi:multiple sugar transport system substrate-binding protein
MKSTMLKLATLLVGFSLLLSGCALFNTGGTNLKAENMTLEFWGVFDASDAYDEIIAAYSQARPNIQIKYRKLRWDEYEKELLEAWAEDRGPDIFMVHNNWVGKYQTKIAAMPAVLKVPWLKQEKGAFKNRSVTVVDTVNMPSLEEMKDLFVPAVYGDTVRDGQIWGLPLAVDNLVLFYNRALLSASNVVAPPKTWNELVTMTGQITKTDNGKLVRSAIAMGTANNNNRFFDILSLLLMQQGALTVDNNGKVILDQTKAEKALDFYLDFAPRWQSNGNKILTTAYTWDDSVAPEATDAFIQGKLAMMFGYIYQWPFLKAQAPNLDIAVTGVPHMVEGGADINKGVSINLANYWLLSAAKKTKHANEAWDFIRFATLGRSRTVDANNQEVIKLRAENYLENNNGNYAKLRTPALNELISKYQKSNDQRFQPGLGQVLTAQSWYRGKDAAGMENVFKQAINAVIYENKETREVISGLWQAIQGINF